MDFHSFKAHLSLLSSVKFSENISFIPVNRLPTGQAGLPAPFYFFHMWQAGNKTSQAILTFVGC